jgi:hypothetical protein
MTRENLTKLYELNDKVKKAEEVSSELLRTAQDRFKQVKHKLMREGKEIEVTEKILWDEVFYLGAISQAGEILGKEHPEVFEAYKAQDATVQELKAFTITELGVDFQKLSLGDYLMLTERLIKLLMDEAGKPAFTLEVGQPPKGTGMEPAE